MSAIFRSQLSPSLLALFVALMEASWIAPGSALVVFLLSDALAPAFPGFVVAGLWLLGHGLTRWALTRAWPIRRVRLFLVVAALLSALVVTAPGLYSQWSSGLAVRREAAQALLVLALWWRAVIMARERLDFERVRGAFGLGATAQMVMLFALGAGGVGAESLAEGVTPVLVFIFAGLLALALARVLEVARYHRGRSDGTLPLVRQWMAIVVLLVASLLLLSLFVAQVVTPDLIVTILAVPLWVLRQLLWGILFVLALGLSLILEPIVQLLRSLIPQASLDGLPQRLNGMDPLTPEFEQTGLPPEVLTVLQWVALALVLAAMLFLLSRAIQRFGESERDFGFREERDSVWSWRTALKQLRGGRWLNLARKARRPGRVAGQVGGGDAVRELYRAFLRLAERLGRPRGVMETPSEYAGQLNAYAPGLQPPTRHLTGLYERVRYGEEELPIDDIKLAQQAVDEFREIVAQRNSGKGS